MARIRSATGEFEHVKIPYKGSMLLAAVTAITFASAVACGSAEDGKNGKPETAPETGLASAQDGSSGAFNSYATAATPVARALAPAESSKALPASGGGGAGGTRALPDSSADFGRKVIVNATMSLNVKDVQAAFTEANRLARGAGGYVEKSGFTNPGSDKDLANIRATVTLRVPAAQYDATLAGLRAIDGAKVQSEGSRSNEVTEQYTDLQSRLRNLEHTEGQYLKLLEQAKTIPEILQVNDRLDSVRGQIEQIQGRLKVLDQLTELATIDLTLAPFPAGKAADDGSRSLGEVFADAWEASLETVAKVAAAGIYAGVAALWLAIPVGLVLFGARRVFRRERGSNAAA